jgi:probable rRNA maturation factor
VRVTVSLHPALTPAQRRSASTARLGPLLRRCGDQLGVAARASLRVRLGDDSELRELSARFLDVDAPTDVLAFPDDRPSEVGDVAISVQRAAAQAEDVVAELRLLAVHGLLHCLGYDHAGAEQAAAMTVITRRLLPGERVPSLR